MTTESSVTTSDDVSICVEAEAPGKSDPSRPPLSVTGAAQDESQSVLTEAKDRAQLTATTAMSVVHVALLKSLLDGGRAANRFYVLVLSLICVSLALQVCAGFLAILVSHMKSYYRSHHNDMCAELWDNFCCCSVRRHSADQPRAVGDRLRQVTAEMYTPGQKGGFCNPRGVAFMPGEGDALTAPPAVPLSRRMSHNASVVAACCCPCVCVTTSATTDEAVLARRFADWSAAAVESELNAAAASVQVGYLDDSIAADTAALRRMRDDKRHLDADAYNAGVRALETSVEAARRQRQQCDADGRLNCVLHRQVDILYAHLDGMRKMYIMKRVSFWQHILNYNLYTVFVCNAFIAGFGVIGANGQAVCL